MGGDSAVHQAGSRDKQRRVAVFMRKISIAWRRTSGGGSDTGTEIILHTRQG